MKCDIAHSMWRLLCFSTFLLVVVADRERQQCRAVDGNLGDCIAVPLCAALEGLAGSSQPEDVSLLRRSACGFTSDGLPEVCCPVVAEDIRTTVSVRTIQTTQRVSQMQHTHKQTTSTMTDVPGSEECPPTVGPPASGCCGVDVSWANRIAGGDIAVIEEHPWLALLEYHRVIKFPDRVETRIETNCGGSLISSRYVLTAAHCLTSGWGAPTNVRLAEYNTSRTDSSGVLVAAVQSWLAHPGHQPERSVDGNDIALLKLRNSAPYTDFIRPICLPSADVLAGGVNLVVAGWGSDGRMFSEVKQSVLVPYVKTAACNAIYGHKKPAVRISEEQICAGGVAGKDSCAGDSGGPLMLLMEQTFSVVGVVSVGPIRCGSEGLPAVYTRVHSFRRWIVDNMR